MAHSAKVIEDSLSPDKIRLTTLEVTFPRIILAEVNTHRVFSRNSASSRAIPVERMLKMVEEDPYIPTHWGKNQKGMSAEEELSPALQEEAKTIWLRGRDHALEVAWSMLFTGVHKQITNRVLEPWLWHTAILSSTEWSNWDHLRANKAAHPEIQLLATMMQSARKMSVPISLGYGQWHLPYIDVAHDDDENEKYISVGRCAAVSYLRHEVKDVARDVARAKGLLAAGHMSPFEHVARPMTEEEVHVDQCRKCGCNWRCPDCEGGVPPFCGNLRGWVQFRKEIPNEADVLGSME